jgi:hypothetical protein
MPQGSNGSDPFADRRMRNALGAGLAGAAGVDPATLKMLALASKNMYNASRMGTGAGLSVDLDSAAFEGQRTAEGFQRVIWDKFFAAGPAVRIRNMRTAADAAVLATLPRTVARVDLTIAAGTRQFADYHASLLHPYQRWGYSNLASVAANLAKCPWVRELGVTLLQSQTAFRMSDLAAPSLERLEIYVAQPQRTANTTSSGSVSARILAENAAEPPAGGALKFFRLRSTHVPDGWHHVRQFLAANADTLEAIDLGATHKGHSASRVAVDQLESLVDGKFPLLTSLRLSSASLSTLSNALRPTSGASEAPLVRACPELNNLDVTVLPRGHPQGGAWSPQGLPGKRLAALTVRLVGPPFERAFNLLSLRLKPGQAFTVHAYQGDSRAFSHHMEGLVPGPGGAADGTSSARVRVVATLYGGSEGGRKAAEAAHKAHVKAYGWPEPARIDHIA